MALFPWFSTWELFAAFQTEVTGKFRANWRFFHWKIRIDLSKFTEITFFSRGIVDLWVKIPGVLARSRGVWERVCFAPLNTSHK